MADEALFLLLHNEMVSGLYKSAEQGEVGIYVLQDNKFRLLTQMSAGKQYLEHASKYLAFTCGLIRGGLSNLGIKSIVTAEVSSMPACKFQVMIQKL
uniref:Trafficking protein particle complex subunit 6B n=1 Tax=Felis catus TaxID=9685 RepID=A0ABI7X8H1_FELCA